MIGVILAAGRGSRLSSACKPLLKLESRYLIQSPLDHLVALGCKKIIIVVGDALIPQALGDAYKDCPLTYVTQQNSQGTAHALHTAKSLIDQSFFLTCGDLLMWGDLPSEFFSSTNPDSGLVLTAELDMMQIERYAAVYSNGQSLIKRIDEKPQEPKTPFGEVGLYRFPRKILDLPLEPGRRGEFELQSLENALIRQGTPLYSVPYEGEWVNVNTPEDLARAQELASRSVFGLKTERSRTL